MCFAIHPTDQHLNQLLGYIEANIEAKPLITLKEMTDKLHAESGLRVSNTTIHAHLEGQLYTLKKVHSEPSSMNSEENRRRSMCVTTVMEAIGDGKHVIYVDECHVTFSEKFHRPGEEGDSLFHENSDLKREKCAPHWCNQPERAYPL